MEFAFNPQKWALPFTIQYLYHNERGWAVSYHTWSFGFLCFHLYLEIPVKECFPHA